MQVPRVRVVTRARASAPLPGQPVRTLTMTIPPPPTPNADETRSTPRLSTAQTLSVVTTAVVLAVLAIAVIAVWITLTRSAIETAQQRLTGSVKQLASVAATNIRQSRPRYLASAHDPAVVAALRDSNPPPASLKAVTAVLQRLATPADSGMPIELWSIRGKRLAFVGNDIPTGTTLDVHPESQSSLAVRPGLDSIRLVDSLQLGMIYREGRRASLWLVAPIIVNGRPLGFIAQQRRIAANPQAEQTIRELSGTSTGGYYRNIDGTGWTTIGGAPAQAPDTALDNVSVHTRSGGRMIDAEAVVPGTPLVIVMEVPRDVIVARPNSVVRGLVAIALVLTIIGAVVAWIAGQRIARPLGRLSRAAESVARGDYSTRVPVAGNQEVFRLSSSFNRMAAEVGDARSMLVNREAELRTLANTIPQLAWMADAAGQLIWFNERWYDCTGAGKDEPHATMWAAAHDPAVLPEVLRRWRTCVESGETFEMEVRLRGRDGNFRWFLTRVAPVHDRDGQVSRWFGTSTDIQSLWDAREAANTANRAKSEFLAAMSHELRTPLNAIGGYTELMEMGVRGPVSAEQRRDLARIRASQQHLLSLIGAVLDLNRIERGRVVYEVLPIAVDPFLHGLEALVLPQAEAKHQRLAYEPGPADLVVCADREKLRQILLNLLSNAIRHSPDGTSITLEAQRVENDRVAIDVRDTGPGIPLERQEAIFEPFVQLDRSLTRTMEGVGLGLAISRDLARGMSGELTVASEPGKGARFRLTLPAAPLDADAIMATTSEMPIR